MRIIITVRCNAHNVICISTKSECGSKDGVREENAGRILSQGIDSILSAVADGFEKRGTKFCLSGEGKEERSN